MSREGERELDRNVKESGQAYVNELVAYHHAMKAVEVAQLKLASQRRRLEEAHEVNEHWLYRRAQHEGSAPYPRPGTMGAVLKEVLDDLDAHGKQAPDTRPAAWKWVEIPLEDLDTHSRQAREAVEQ